MKLETEESFFKGNAEEYESPSASVKNLDTDSGISRAWIAGGAVAVVAALVLQDAIDLDISEPEKPLLPDLDEADGVLDRFEQRSVEINGGSHENPKMSTKTTHVVGEHFKMNPSAIGELREAENLVELFENVGPLDAKYVSLDVSKDVLESVRILRTAIVETNTITSGQYEIENAIASALNRSDMVDPLITLENSINPFIKENAKELANLVTFLNEVIHEISVLEDYAVYKAPFLNIFDHSQVTMHADRENSTIVTIGLPTIYQGPEGEVLLPDTGNLYIMRHGEAVLHRAPNFKEIENSKLGTRVTLVF